MVCNWSSEVGGEELASLVRYEAGLDWSVRVHCIMFLCSQTDHSKPVSHPLNDIILTPSTGELPGLYLECDP
jgi:hypothetical protein